MKATKKTSRIQRGAVLAERERIRNNLLSHLQALMTSRADDYGQGWNAALRQVEQAVVKKR